jgi:hypothetical protein
MSKEAEAWTVRFVLYMANTDKKSIRELSFMNSEYTQIGPYEALQLLDDTPDSSVDLAYILIHNGKEYAFQIFLIDDYGFQILLADQKTYLDMDQILSTFRFVGSSSSSGNKNEISWEEAVELIKNCQVTMVSQTHSRDVYLSLRDGTSRSTVEPRIDMVSQEAGNASDKCGFGILIATE